MRLRALGFLVAITMVVTTVALAAPPPGAYFRVSFAEHNCGTVYKGHKRFVINWGPTDPNILVNVYLVPVGKFQPAMVVARNLHNYGRYVWRLPGTVDDGDYRFEVVQVNNTGKRGFSKVFKVASVPSSAELLMVKEPGTTEKVLWKGNKAVVRWQHHCGLTGSDAVINIELVPVSGSGHFTMKTGVKLVYDTVLDAWVPASVPSGQYRVRLATSDGRIWGESSVIKVLDLPSLKVLSPRSNSTLLIGRAYKIKWSTVTVGPTNLIEIYLIQGASSTRLYRGANTHEFLWKISPKVKPGVYSIKVKAVQWNVEDGVTNITLKNFTLPGKGSKGLGRIPLGK